MKYLFLFLSFYTATLYAQTTLQFDKRFVECEDKWVAFEKGKDNTYDYGFIYIDAEAGLTLNYEGSFTITEAGKFVAKKLDSTSLKVRLTPNNVKVAFIPESKYEELAIAATPDWLQFYKTDTASVERLYKWGYMYNGWNSCAKALTYLEKAQTINADFKGLSVELAFSYNCLGQYDKAIAVLQHALIANATDAYTNKELIYAQLKSGQIEEAAKSCKKALELCTNTAYNGENCYNLLYNYFVKKDKANFALWVTETRKWTADNASLTKSIKAMENELAKQ
jgi:tetratricopeptide (TPR) repeat protein